jgi:drug/metabolite transporter (DMT)-like permease
MNIGLLWIPASVWQMLRGSMVIFSAILSILFLKRKLYGFNWLGIGFVTLGLVVVAVSCLKAKTTASTSTTSEELIGILLVVAAQVVQASQIVIEEFLLKNIKADPFLIVGLEGFWGTIVCSILLVPIGHIPDTTQIGKTFHEDTIDTFDMIGNSNAILFTAILYVFAILGYNLFGMLVTQSFTAVHRTILEAVRTMCIWVTNLFIYYAITEKHGEKLVAWSAVELLGFVFLLIGLFIYNKVIKVSFLGCKYPEDK